MTPGNNGASTPEDDDPFGYLYADGQANGAQPPSGGYGYPNSVNRVRPVGTRQYGAPQGQGVYVTGFNQVGAKVTWTVDGIEKAGGYRLNVRYGIPGKDADATLVINGKASARPLNMKNFGGTPEGDWEKGWQTTWANVNLAKGTNTIELACNDGNKCDLVLDKLSLSSE